MKINKQTFRTIIGYAIVIAIIFSFVYFAIYIENYSSNTKGKYAEYIKENVLYKVTKVLDGDTFIVYVSGHEITIRLLGIDTPEIVDPRKPVQCYAEEASEEAKRILNDESIYLEKDIEKEKISKSYDIYGRVLAYARLSDGLSYNQYMIENGFAREYTFNKEEYKYQKEFKEIEEKAKKNKLGLWGRCK